MRKGKNDNSNLYLSKVKEHNNNNDHRCYHYILKIILYNIILKSKKRNFNITINISCIKFLCFYSTNFSRYSHLGLLLLLTCFERNRCCPFFFSLLFFGNNMKY